MFNSYHDVAFLRLESMTEAERRAVDARVGKGARVLVSLAGTAVRMLQLGDRIPPRACADRLTCTH
jgi:hypothetical protein